MVERTVRKQPPKPQAKPRQAAGQPRSGFAMLLVFAMAAAVAIMLYMELPRLVFESRRILEQDLISRGEQYRRAIQLYVRKYNRYPASLEDLEGAAGVRFLRRRYKDPLTGSDQWRLIHIDAAGVFTDSLVYKRELKKEGEQQPSNTFITERAAFGSAEPQPASQEAAARPLRGASDRPVISAESFSQIEAAAGVGSPAGMLPAMESTQETMPRAGIHPVDQESASGAGVPQPGTAPTDSGPQLPEWLRAGGQGTEAARASNVGSTESPQPGVPPIAAGAPSAYPMGFVPQSTPQVTGPQLQQPGQAAIGVAPSLITPPVQGPGVEAPAGTTMGAPGVVPGFLLPQEAQPPGAAVQPSGSPSQPFGAPGRFPAPAPSPTLGGAPGEPPALPYGQAYTPFIPQPASSQPAVQPAASWPAPPSPAAPPAPAPGLTGPIGSAGSGTENPALQLIQQILTSPRPGGMPGAVTAAAPQGPILGGGIAGVASTMEGESIMVYGGRNKYQEWEFIYDFRQDKAAVARAAMGGAQAGQTGPVGATGPRPSIGSPTPGFPGQPSSPASGFGFPARRRD